MTISRLVGAAGILLFSATMSAAQAPPPIDGVTGTIAPEENVEETYGGIHAVAVRAFDGVKHFFHVGAVASAGEDGLKTTEGVITTFDRAAKTVSLRLADGTEQIFRLTERAAADAAREVGAAGTAGSAKVVVYFSDTGRRVAHYVKRIS
jgi:hypothetical protein